MVDILQGLGLKIVAISDSEGGVFAGSGIDTPKVARARFEGAKVRQCGAGEVITNAELLALDVDILVLAARERTVTGKESGTIRARVVAEAANSPISPRADEELVANGVSVLPDLLANAGGLVVSYFEWVQDLQAFFWDDDQVNSQLDRAMKRTLGKVRDAAEKGKLTLREAAHRLAIEKVARATEVRGIYP